MVEIDRVYNEDNVQGLRKLTDECIDLTVTSPPYDNLRRYDGYTFDFKSVARELYRVTKQGGVVVWVVGDATIDRSETGTSFRQALYFMECGFKLNDTMIWFKKNPIPTMLSTRYTQSFEYMFVFSKGRVKTFNPIMERCVHAGQSYTSTVRERGSDGNPDFNRKQKNFTIHDERPRFNVWRIGVQQEKFAHPAVFPEQVAADHIKSWSNEGDVVLDPFMGSGTTAVAAIKLHRKFIGFEISEKYCDIANERIRKEQMQPTLF